jgi:allantoin racemase
MKIRVIVPHPSKEFEAHARNALSPAARPDTELSVVSLDKGPASTESRYERATAVPDTVAKIVQAEKDGAEAVIPDCMGDPGLEEGRERVSIPVIGPTETSMHFAAMLGHRFSVVTVLDRLAPYFEECATRTGQRGRLASVRSVNIPVLELGDQARAVQALVEEAAKAVRDDGAHVIFFGCTGMTGLAKQVEEGLKKEGITDVPVIDPAVLALKVAEALAEMGLSHSKRTYPLPPEKEIIGYD